MYTLLRSVESFLLITLKRTCKVGCPTKFGSTHICFDFLSFFSEGEQWRKVRRVLARKMGSPRAVDVYSEGINEVITDMIKRLRYVRDTTRHQDGLVPDLTNEMYKWSMECKFNIHYNDNKILHYKENK